MKKEKNISLKKAKSGDELQKSDGTSYLVYYVRTRRVKGMPIHLEDYQGIIIVDKELKNRFIHVSFSNSQYKLIKITDESNNEILEKAKEYRSEIIRESLRSFSKEISSIVNQSINI